MGIELGVLKVLLDTKEKETLINGYKHNAKLIKRLLRSLGKGMTVSIYARDMHLTVEYVDGAVDGKITFIGVLA